MAYVYLIQNGVYDFAVWAWKAGGFWSLVIGFLLMGFLIYKAP